MSYPPKKPRVAVIGSGLAALGAVQGLIAHGIKPVILDRGERLEKDLVSSARALAGTDPSHWTPEQRAWLEPDASPKDGSGVPKKRVFGSEYFYGTDRPEAPVKTADTLPPFSYALGGLSCGWGAAVLPPQSCDLTDWPIEAEELSRYCSKALATLPYSAENDGLSLNFPILSPTTGTIRLSPAGQVLLGALEKARVLKKDETVFGRSRQLLHAQGPQGCLYCGHCMSGCVYGSIFNAGEEIERLEKAGFLEYVPGCLVDRVEEKDGQAWVEFRNGQGGVQRDPFDRVFLAAGAVNSARIVATSLRKFGEPLRLNTRGGFVLPALSLKKLPSSWPQCNTEPGLFLDFRGKGLDHWVHVQVSTENEIVLKKLGVLGPARGLVGAFKKFLSEHLFLLFVNYHSDHSGVYELSLERPAGPDQPATLRSDHRKSLPSWGVLWATARRLTGLLARIGCLPLFPFAKINSGSYHVGGTLPMTQSERKGFQSDRLGRVGGWKRIHAVDSSVFPSLPGTTIGLLLMANAYRIVDQSPWEEAT
jgi:choline dehydrogenase-like flavoprotein